MEITQELVRELFDYNNGFLYWKEGSKLKRYIDSNPIGATLSKRADGDRFVVKIKRRPYLCSRIIFLWHHVWLPEIVDHENRITTDNRIGNLRAASHSQNQKNKKSKCTSTSEYLGVCFCRDRDNWQARIRFDNQDLFLGRFKSQEQAALAYNRAAVKYHKEFANLNIIQPNEQ